MEDGQCNWLCPNNKECLAAYADWALLIFCIEVSDHEVNGYMIKDDLMDPP